MSYFMVLQSATIDIDRFDRLASPTHDAQRGRSGSGCSLVLYWLKCSPTPWVRILGMCPLLCPSFCESSICKYYYPPSMTCTGPRRLPHRPPSRVHDAIYRNPSLRLNRIGCDSRYPSRTIPDPFAISSRDETCRCPLGGGTIRSFRVLPPPC